MTNLWHVPVDWLKIDRSFIAEVHRNERVQQLVRGQIAVASSLHLNLIAEGVENQEQADWASGGGMFSAPRVLVRSSDRGRRSGGVISKSANNRRRGASCAMMCWPSTNRPPPGTQ